MARSQNVSYYLETDNIAGWQSGAGGDQLLGTATDSSNNWSFTFSTASVTPGLRTVYAVATDDQLGTSQPAGTTVTVNPINQPPQIIFITANPTQITQPATTTIFANGVTDSDGTVAAVNFYIDDNGLAGLQTGLGGDTNSRALRTVISDIVPSFHPRATRTERILFSPKRSTI